MVAALVPTKCFPKRVIQRVGPTLFAGLVALLVGSEEVPVLVAGLAVVVVMGAMRHRSR